MEAVLCCPEPCQTEGLGCQPMEEAGHHRARVTGSGGDQGAGESGLKRRQDQVGSSRASWAPSLWPGSLFVGPRSSCCRSSRKTLSPGACPMSGRGRTQAVSTQLRAQQAYHVCPTRSQPQPKTQQEHRMPEKGLCEVCRNLCMWAVGGTIHRHILFLECPGHLAGVLDD